MIKRILPIVIGLSLLLTGCTAPQQDSKLPPSATELAVPNEPNTDTDILPKEEEAAEDFSLCAYLPVSSAPPSLEEYLPSVKHLDYLVLNTGVYWNENGELEISPAFKSAVEQLEGQTALWCTVNPSGELIRSSTAGACIDTPQKREQLSENIAAFARQYHLQGIDIDWEFPAPNEWTDFSELITSLKQQLSDIQLSLALYPKDIFLSDESISSIDRIHMMAYDLFDEQGYHSTMQTAQDAADYFLSLGFSPSQLSLGIPAYGRPLDASAEWIFYRDIDLQSVSNDTPNLIEDVFFNSPQLAAQKAAYAKEKGFCGTMLYQLLCDKTDEQSLILTLRNTLDS